MVQDGVFCDSKLVQQVDNFGEEYHISFNTPEIMAEVAKTFRVETQAGERFFIDPVEMRRSYIKVYDLPYEVKSDSLALAFGQFGKVGEATRDKFPGRAFFNGIRTVAMYLNEDAVLPSSMVIEGFKARVMNTSVVHCSYCKENGHIRKNCPSLKCNKCGLQGHFANQCPEAYCTLCNINGHWTRQCRVGLAKKSNPAKEKEKQKVSGNSKGKDPAKVAAPPVSKVQAAGASKATYATVACVGPTRPSTSGLSFANSGRKRSYVPSSDDVSVPGGVLSARQRPLTPVPTHNRFAGFSNEEDDDDDFEDDGGTCSPELMDHDSYCNVGLENNVTT